MLIELIYCIIQIIISSFLCRLLQTSRGYKFPAVKGSWTLLFDPVGSEIAWTWKCIYRQHLRCYASPWHQTLQLNGFLASEENLQHTLSLLGDHRHTHYPALNGLWDQIGDTFMGHMTQRGVPCTARQVRGRQTEAGKTGDLIWGLTGAVHLQPLYTLLAPHAGTVLVTLCLAWLSFHSVPRWRVSLSINRKDSNPASGISYVTTRRVK